MIMKTKIKCRSGLTGWQCFLQENYDSFEQWKAYSDVYGLAGKLGFKSPFVAWEKNPLLRGSVNPDDFEVVKLPRKVKK